MGDPAGIGAEIAIRAWMDRTHRAPDRFAFYGDPALIEARARMLGLSVRVEAIAQPSKARAMFGTAIPVIEVTLPKPARPGLPDAENAPAVIAAIDRAVSDVAEGRARGIVTCPIASPFFTRQDFAIPVTLSISRRSPPVIGRVNTIRS